MPFRKIENKKYISQKWLKPRWNDTTKSLYEIAKEADCAVSTLVTWAKRFGWKNRKRFNDSPDMPYKNYKWLYHYYWDLEYSMTDIAKKFYTRISVISYWMHKLKVPCDKNRRKGINPNKKPVNNNPCSNKEWLKKEYCINKKSSRQIAAECDCVYETVLYWLRIHKIPARGKNEPRNERPLYHNPTWLYEHYITQLLSIKQIANFVKADPTTIHDWLKKHNIPIRDKNFARWGIKPWRNKEWLFNQYMTLDKSTNQIGEENNCDLKVISLWLRKFNYFKEKIPKDINRSENLKSRNAKIYSEWRLAVFTRDNWTCQMPGCINFKSILHAHHIKTFADNPNERYNLSNGITLCESCHALTIQKEPLFEDLFNSIINSISLRFPR